MKLKGKIVLLLLSVVLISCSNDDVVSVIQPSISQIEMEAEGGETEVSFNNGDWYVAEIINQSGDVRIHGNTYSQDGEMILENSVLYLEAEGKMEALWPDKGFVIDRNAPASLTIQLKENSTGEEFNFLLILKSGEERKEINVKQKVSQGYQFDKMEFSLKEGDGDSLYVKKGTTYKFDVPASQEFSVSPYGGVDVHNHSIFLSSEKDAFTWIEKDSVMVEVPTDIYNNEIYFNAEERLYGKYSSITPHGFENMETVTIPAGQSGFFFEQEWKKRQVSYKLYLTNNRTGGEKVIEGKWIETTPTGGYAVQWEDQQQ